MFTLEISFFYLFVQELKIKFLCSFKKKMQQKPTIKLDKK